jgi:ligand-binding SRPBCC domain-containing protein
MHELTRTQKLPISVEQAWNFFSSPKNLAEITPEGMGFEITTDKKDLETMYSGQIIGYIVKPVLGIPMQWVTEIKAVENGHFFIDEQRFGPYAFWHHKHFFKKIDGGVEMRDVIHYKVPLGFLGRIANWIFVRQKLESIFEYRFQKLEAKFGKM